MRSATTFPSLRLPPGIAFARIGPGDPPSAPLPRERALLSPQALPERVAEFGRGRAAARRALAALGVPGAASLPILRRGQRSPDWPAGVVGTITHSAGWAAAACATSDRFRGVGIDLERVRPAGDALAARILRPEERSAWMELAEAGRAIAFALIFSAKESIYKALNPATGVFLGYQDVAVTLAESDLAADASDSAFGFTWVLHRDCGEDFPTGFEGDGSAACGEGLVLTGVWV